jgi:hypothetical protein
MHFVSYCISIITLVNKTPKHTSCSGKTFEQISMSEHSHPITSLGSQTVPSIAWCWGPEEVLIHGPLGVVSLCLYCALSLTAQKGCGKNTLQLLLSVSLHASCFLFFFLLLGFELRALPFLDKATTWATFHFLYSFMFYLEENCLIFKSLCFLLPSPPQAYYCLFKLLSSENVYEII